MSNESEGIYEEVVVAHFAVLTQLFICRGGGHVALTKNRKGANGLDSCVGSVGPVVDPCATPF
jgi:hypothetical protein